MFLMNWAVGRNTQNIYTRTDVSALGCSWVMTQIRMWMFLMNWAVGRSSAVDPQTFSLKSAPDGHGRVCYRCVGRAVL